MSQNFSECATNHIRSQKLRFDVGRVEKVANNMIVVGGLDMEICLGDRAEVISRDCRRAGEVVRLDKDGAMVLLEQGGAGVGIGDRVRVVCAPGFSPDASWLGRVIDPDGTPLDGRALIPGVVAMPVDAAAPSAHGRRSLGVRLETGLAVFNTLLPIVRGQRLGLFAGSGVGKSTLMGNLANGIDADVIVVALVGERGREVQQFVRDTIGEVGMKRTVVIAATSDQSPQTRRRCAPSAMSVAEYFRNQGLQVLLLVDSITRFCEAHRELVVAGGEPANLRGYPASTGPAIARLCERAGPGGDGQGDITAVFSVLVAGSDMDEPVADMLRGVLDGHVVLDRQIAEQGRFPAVDILRSVSRSLPAAASQVENDLIHHARAALSEYDRSKLMIQSGLYVAGSDPNTDKAIACFSALNDFLGIIDSRGALAHFAKLRQSLAGVSRIDR
ncbi:MAG: flagellum-specific ATP synthase [Gammaproteobacteria bacterium]|jgi:flagellum-specific ATP synthase